MSLVRLPWLRRLPGRLFPNLGEIEKPRGDPPALDDRM